MILRPDYIEAVKPFMDAPLVKFLQVFAAAENLLFLK